MKRKTKPAKIIKNHCHTLDTDIRVMVSALLLKYDKRINPNLIKSYVVECQRGRAHCKENVITVPRWAHTRGKGYFKYYVAHELSHIISWRKYRNDAHDKHFYEVFKRLCPEDTQFHELGYKKRSGVSFGVKGELEKALIFKYGENYTYYKK